VTGKIFNQDSEKIIKKIPDHFGFTSKRLYWRKDLVKQLKCTIKCPKIKKPYKQRKMRKKLKNKSSPENYFPSKAKVINRITLSNEKWERERLAMSSDALVYSGIKMSKVLSKCTYIWNIFVLFVNGSNVVYKIIYHSFCFVHFYLSANSKFF